MKKIALLAAAAAITLAPAAAFAQASTVGGATTGAVVGGVVGGPVGAVVGAGVGGAIGNAAEPPREVITYVEGEQLPAETVVVQEQVVVGKPVPSTVRLRAVPNHTEYRYAVVNKERVIVDQRGTVVKIIQ